MYAISLLTFFLVQPQPQPLGPGEHARSVMVGDQKRTYLVHVPPRYDAAKRTPVVLVYHGAGTNGLLAQLFTGLNTKADEANFIAVYPDGSGVGPFLVWNAGPFKAREGLAIPDDVAFTAKMLDDLATVLNVDTKRVYATGISNGGMMCYKLAAELPGRIAAIAPVAGTMVNGNAKPTRPVPVIHFHGTEDNLVPFGGGTSKKLAFIIKSVDESVQTWAKLAECPKEPKVEDIPSKVEDGTKVKRKTFGPGKDGVEVILYIIEGGGHTWPGRPAPSIIGRSTNNISANDLMWEFFSKYQLK